MIDCQKVVGVVIGLIGLSATALAGSEGVEDGLAWSLTISKKDGKSVLSASGDGVAYVVFGTCTPVKKN